MLRCLIAILFTFTCSMPAFAQASWQFRWTKGLTLNYKIKHVTSVTEVVETAKNTSDSQLDLLNQWQVLDVDARHRDMQLTLTAMRNEQKRADTLFDSQNLTRARRSCKQMKKYIGSTLAIIILMGSRVHGEARLGREL